jgi:hypothetical protein
LTRNSVAQILPSDRDPFRDLLLPLELPPDPQTVVVYIWLASAFKGHSGGGFLSAAWSRNRRSLG